MDDGAALPWDALREAVGRFDGERLWPRNAAMRRWLADAGLGPGLESADPVPFAALPFEADERAALLAGEGVAWTRGERHWQVRRIGSGVDGFLLAEDTTALRSAEALALGAARARALAGVAGTFVHDLNNHLNLALALLAQVRSMGVSEDDARVCDELATGAQFGAGLSRALARLLAREFDRRERVDLGEAVGDAIVAITKVCAQRGVALEGAVGRNGIEVRASAGELDGVLIQLLMAAAEVRPQRLAVRLERVDAAIAGGRVRPVARLLVEVTTASAESVAGFVAAGLEQPGCLRGLVGAGHHGASLAQVGLGVRRLGGEFTVLAHASGASLLAALPIVVDG